MKRHAKLTRRAVLAAIPICGLSTQLGAWPVAAERTSIAPLLQIEHVASASGAAELVSALRKAPGCVGVEVFSETGGRISVFARWVSEAASFRFRQARPLRMPPPTYERLEV